MNEFFHAITLLLILLNPFLVIVYVMELVQDLNQQTFNRILFRGGIIASGVFTIFALVGDALFTDFLHAEFASFQIFGGIVFLIVGINFMLKGNAAIEALRGPPEYLAGSIAMPLLIGPTTVSASVLIGEALPPALAVAGVLVSVGSCVLVMMGLKAFHDWVKPRNESLVQRYIEVAGRVTALVVGIYAVEMIMAGVTTWVERIVSAVG